MFKLACDTKAHDDSIWSTTWCKDEESDIILTASVDDLVKSWKWDGASTLECKQTMKGHRLGVCAVDISNDGKVAVSGSFDHDIKLWDVENGDLIKTIQAGPVSAYTVALHPKTPKTTLAAGGLGRVHIYNAESGQIEQKLEMESGKLCTQVVYNATGEKLASASMDGKITVFDMTTGKNGSVDFNITDAHEMPVRSLAFNSDPASPFLITGSDDGFVKMFDARTGTTFGTLTGHASWVFSVDCSPDGNYVASGSSDKTVKVWDLRAQRALHTFSDHNDQVWSVSFNHNGRSLASCGDDQRLCVYECP